MHKNRRGKKELGRKKKEKKTEGATEGEGREIRKEKRNGGKLEDERRKEGRGKREVSTNPPLNIIAV